MYPAARSLGLGLEGNFLTSEVHRGFVSDMCEHGGGKVRNRGLNFKSYTYAA